MSDEPKDDDKASDDARALILARRARFVAAAMASLGIACGKESKTPEPCLSVVEIDGGSADASSVDASGGSDAGLEAASPSTPDAASAPDAASPPDAGAPSKPGAPPEAPPPQPCLSAPPQACLKVAPPRPCLLR